MTVHAPFSSKLLRMARALPDGKGRPPKQLTSQQKADARKLAHTGISAAEIHREIAPNMALATFKKRIDEIGIKTSTWRRSCS